MYLVDELFYINNLKCFKQTHAQDVIHFIFLIYAMFFYLVGTLYQPLFIILLSRAVSCCLHFWFSATNNRTRHGSDVLMSDHGKVRASRRLISGSHEPFSWEQRAPRTTKRIAIHHCPRPGDTCSLCRGNHFLKCVGGGALNRSCKTFRRAIRSGFCMPKRSLRSGSRIHQIGSPLKRHQGRIKTCSDNDNPLSSNIQKRNRKLSEKFYSYYE